MFKKISNYLGDKERWNELGHSFFGFIIGCMGPYIIISWIVFVLIDEFVIDGHWDFWRESKEEILDLIFDLQSKLLSVGLGYLFIEHIKWEHYVCCVHSYAYLFLIFLIGYKASWFRK